MSLPGVNLTQMWNYHLPKKQPKVGMMLQLLGCNPLLSTGSRQLRFNDLIMVAMLSNLAHTFEVGGQSVSWLR